MSDSNLDHSKAQDFARLVAMTSRVFNALGQVPVLNQVPLDLAHWVALALIHANQGLTAAQLARDLGVRRERANSILATFVEAKFVESLGGAPEKFALTLDGRTFLDAVNAKITDWLSGIDKRQMVRRANRIMLELLRYTRLPSSK